MARKRPREQLRSISTIDITPLVDLTFLLLIVFMITAPVLEQAVDVEVPELTAEAITEPDVATITLDREGQVHFRDAVFPLDAFAHRLRQLHQREPRLQLFVRADQARPYGEVMAVMRAARHAGYTGVALVTEAEE